jgi:hypothetical protein
VRVRAQAAALARAARAAGVAAAERLAAAERVPPAGRVEAADRPREAAAQLRTDRARAGRRRAGQAAALRAPLPAKTGGRMLPLAPVAIHSSTAERASARRISAGVRTPIRAIRLGRRLAAAMGECAASLRTAVSRARELIPWSTAERAFARGSAVIVRATIRATRARARACVAARQPSAVEANCAPAVSL